MRKLLLVLALVLLATPSFGQDEIILSDSDIDALLGGGGGNRGNRGNQNQPQIPDPDMLYTQLKDLLKDNKVALDKNQEKSLQTLLKAETATMRTELEAQFRGGNNRGNQNNNNQMTMITDLVTAVAKHNTALLTEVKAGLAPDQVALLTKAEKDSKKVCSVALDLVNFQQMRERSHQHNNNFRGTGPGGFDFGGEIGDVFGGGGGGGGGRGGGRGGNNNFLQLIPERASCTQSNSTTAQRLAVLGDILTKGKKPFTPDQDTKVAALIEGKMKLITDELKAKNSNMEQMLNDLNRNNNNQNRGNQNQNQNQQLPTVNVQTLTNNIVNTIMQNLGIQTNNNQGGRGGRGGNDGGGRGNFPEGGNRGGNNPAANANNNLQNNQGNRGNNFNPQQEIQRRNEELYDKIAASLKPEQGTFVKKIKYDQIKARGGVDRFRAILEEEGTPMLPAQITQVQNMLNAQNQAIRNAATTLVQREIQALPEGALQAAAQQYLAEQQRLQQQNGNPQQNRNNNNLSNVNQNTEAQKIIQKALPEVSKQKALLEKTTLDQILTRVFTPPQVASYKLSSM